MSSLRIFEKEVSITVAIASLTILSILSYAEGQSGPTVPDKPTLTATVISASQVNLSWTTPSNGGSPITGYKIEYKIIPTPGTYSLLVQINGNTTTTYSHTGLQSDKYYVYHILAINSVGNSEWSAEVIGHTEQPQNIVPNPPTSLTARAVSPTQINLSWTAPTNNGGPPVTGYKIEEKVGTGSFTVIVTNTGNTNTSYSRTSLTTGTSYTYKVSAINSVGPSTTSNEASATPTPTSSITLPSPPTNLSATKVSQTQVNLSWNAPSDNGGSAITGYKIEEKVGTGSFTVIVANTGNTNTSYSRTGLTAGLTYTYKVSAINSAGTSSPSNEVTSSQTIIAVPNPPSNLVVASASPTQLNLSWKAPSDNGGPAVTGYKIEVKSGSNPYAILVSNTGSVTSYSHSGLTTGTTYTYKVSAINSVGTGSPSNEVSAKPIKTIVPTSLTAVATSPTQIRLTWFAPSETFGQTISGYKIERKISEGTFITIVENTNSQTTTHSISGLTTGTTYTFLVSASYPLGASGQSNEASATPTPTSTAPPASPPPSSTPSTSPPPPQQTGTSPNQPTSLTARAVSPTKISLFWVEPTNNGGSLVVGYKIEMKSSGGSWSTLTANTGYATATYSKDGLITGTQYTFRVSAINSVGTGSPSNEASATPKSSSEPEVPAAPTDLTPKAISSTQINMTWKAPIDNGGLTITGYKISQKIGSNTYRTLVDDTKSTTTSYLHSNLTAGVMYTYKISTINSVGTGNPSNEASATTTAPTPTTTPTPIPTPTPTPTPSPSTLPSIGRVKVPNTDYALRYDITGGTVLGTVADVETNSLLIKIETTGDGVLNIPLPRELIDAKTDKGDDDVFYVLVDNKKADFDETVRTTSRTLEISFPDGTEEITIYGTQVVPEFGTLASFILAISIVSIIAVTAKPGIISKL